MSVRGAPVLTALLPQEHPAPQVCLEMKHLRGNHNLIHRGTILGSKRELAHECHPDFRVPRRKLGALPFPICYKAGRRGNAKTPAAGFETTWTILSGRMLSSVCLPKAAKAAKANPTKAFLRVLSLWASLASGQAEFKACSAMTFGAACHSTRNCSRGMRSFSANNGSTSAVAFPSALVVAATFAFACGFAAAFD